MRWREVAVVLIAPVLTSLMFTASWAASSGDVVINEIAWMGTLASTGDEWIELYNTTAMPIDIEGWSIYGADTETCLNFSAADGSTTWNIPAYGYLIYANDDTNLRDSSGTSIVDIWDLTIGLNNEGPGQVILYDAPNCVGNVIDTANQGDGVWFAGDATNRRTMERGDPSVSGEDESNWATFESSIAANGFDEDSNPIQGTPGARNSATNSPPVADAGPEQIALLRCEVLLDGSASSDPNGDSLSYSWSFTSMPAGSTSALSDPIAVNPTFVANIHGDYRLELVVDDGYGGSDVDHVTVTVHAPPAAGFAYSPDQATTWDTVQFTDQSSDPDGTIVTWSWDFGGGAVSSEQNPTYRYALPGIYQATLEVTDNDGLTHASANEITILPGPGDVDGNGAINLLDVRLCLQIAEGVIPGTIAQRIAADVDEDGDVDNDDAQLLAMYVIGIAD